jgi:glycosyltransferase involved in cell wall biosynthesis
VITGRNKRETSVKSDQPSFSIVIPVHNERDSVDELVSSIEQALGPVSRDYEILFIDDGSTDDTLDRLRRLVAAHPAIRIFSFRKNVGKSAALECGFRHAKGRYILTMDADLQTIRASSQI